MLIAIETEELWQMLQPPFPLEVQHTPDQMAMRDILRSSAGDSTIVTSRPNTLQMFINSGRGDEDMIHVDLRPGDLVRNDPPLFRSFYNRMLWRRL